MKKQGEWFFRIFFIITYVLFFQVISLSGHSYRVPVIVDTDMALDDARALVLLLNADMCNIQLAVTSDGAVAPEKGSENLKQILIHFNLASVPVVWGRTLMQPPPPWRSWTQNVIPVETKGVSLGGGSANAAARIVKVLQESPGPCLYLCLGPLTNLADALVLEPGIKEKISRVIYFGSAPDVATPDWNTARDNVSAQRVFASGLPIYMVSSPEVKSLPFHRDFFEKITLLATPASQYMVKLHDHAVVSTLLADKHFRIWDEIAIIYLSNPDLFQFKKQRANHFEITAYEPAKVYERYLKLLGFSADSHLKEREIVVLDTFPVEASMFKADVRPSVNKILKKFGLEEWKACVLTNELHRHLGIYSIIGAKMGIRAREILDAPLDALEVVSFAGLQPPLSCLNDGLQVSTGASLGRGTIKISNLPLRPAAMFIYNGQKLTLTIKGELVARIKKDIRAGIEKYGDLSRKYFNYVRQLSIQYWFEMDRMTIFEPAETTQ